jgi:hypothetical protein
MRPSTHPCIIGRDGNVVVVDFAGKPEPPAPPFPGANGLRETATAAPEGERLPPLRWFEHRRENRYPAWTQVRACALLG